jgi:hypothetical protein
MKHYVQISMLMLSCILVNTKSFSQPVIGLETVAGGFTKPVGVVSAGDSRLFIVEQDGRIKILHGDGSVSTFLDINYDS